MGLTLVTMLGLYHIKTFNNSDMSHKYDFIVAARLHFINIYHLE